MNDEFACRYFIVGTQGGLGKGKTVKAMEGIVRQVIREASPDGLIGSYLRNQGNWEGPQRCDFQSLALRLKQEGLQSAEVRQRAIPLLWNLRNNYRVQYFKKDKCADFVDVAFDTLAKHGWQQEPPHLFEQGISAADEISSIIVEVLAQHQKTLGRRDYSLLTKFLHFLYPETFAIYDGQAAASIRMWSFFEFCSQVHEKDVWTTIGDSSGFGYHALLDFYLQFWACAGDLEKQTMLRQKAAEYEKSIAGRVTVLDLLDKLLWKANGFPVRLGLLGDTGAVEKVQ